jgi:peptidoglycan-associated lipoprotein
VLNTLTDRVYGAEIVGLVYGPFVVLRHRFIEEFFIMALTLRQVALCSVALVSVACSKKKAPEPTLEAKAAAAATPAPPAPVATPVAAPTPAAPALDTADFASETIYFDFDSFTVKASEADKLRKLAAVLKANSGAPVKIQIEGHCDERGSNEYNLALGEKRARAIQDALAAEGVPAGNLTTISYGEERPAVEGRDEAAHSKNRRGEFKKL